MSDPGLATAVADPETSEQSPAPEPPPDASWERVEQLRRAVAELESSTERQREELAEQEARWEAAEAERLHQERLAEARAEFEAARDTYSAASTHADAFLAELHTATCRIAGLYKTAVRAERACQDAEPALRAAAERLAELGESPAGADVSAPRQLVFAPGDPRRGAMLAGLIAYPGTRRELAQLEAPTVLASAPPGPDLEELLSRIDARRREASAADHAPVSADQVTAISA
jgi:hypothetical protein